MKRTILFLVVWLAFVQVALSQKTVEKTYIDSVPRYVPDEYKAVSFDFLVGENQKFLKKMNADFVETPPAVIEIQERTRGNKYARVYVNNDYINIVCHGINARNYKDFKVYKHYMLSPKNVEANSLGYPMDFQISKVNPTTLLDDQLNDEKSRLFQNAFWYCIKDNSGRIVATLTMEFVFPKPELYQIYINKDLIKQLKDRPVESAIYTKGLTERNNNELARENKAVNANDTTDVPSKLVLRAGNKDVLFLFKALNYQTDNYLEYRLDDGGWKTTAKKEYPHILLEDIEPGKYTLQVRYPLQPDVFGYEFEIEPALTQTTSFKVIKGVLITAFLGIGLFYMYSSRQKKKLKAEVNKRTQLQYQISYLQSQLQPHFIFNALNSIQGLINKKNIEDANIYISKFGALLHEVIGKNDKTMQPLATEIKQVEYYLQLEQLRFKFQYKIAVAENVNITEVNIPTMLLQPFVENAIKHGIVEKKEAGVIEVVIEKNGNDLLIEIKDNGKGYDTNTTNAGRGNTMVEERIHALNKFLKDQNITLTTRSTLSEGTRVSFHFVNWF
jgi:anti-sigma regulatory factor (Ser/Thr protein kinase)